jgi:hypothetical protein
MAPILGIYASQISGHLFAPSGAYDSIATVTVGGAGSSSISFSSIPSTYQHLQIRYTARTNRSATSDLLNITLNGSATTTGHFLYGTGAAASAGVLNSFVGWATANSATSNAFGTGVIDVLDYANTNKNRVLRALAGWDGNGDGEIALTSVLQTSTTALSSFTITPVSGSFVQYTQFALYGVKGQ